MGKNRRRNRHKKASEERQRTSETEDERKHPGAETKKLESAVNIGKEPDQGNVEYKWRLTNISEDRLEHLTTQMNFRLNEGLGECLYQVGYEDNGHPKGLPDADLKTSINTIKKMATKLKNRADVLIVHYRQGVQGKVAELLVTRNAEDTFIDVRVCVCGHVFSGKTTLIGVLTTGKLDNGKGSARLNVFRHPHEVARGQTSSMSEQILGFSKEGNIINYSLFRRGWPDIISSSSKVVSFIDLAGHERYAKTTVLGLTGQQPDYVMLMISATAKKTDLNITFEQMHTAFCLNIPVFICITKTDLEAELDEVTANIKVRLEELKRTHLFVSSVEDAEDYVKSIDEKTAPIFQLSSVSGAGLDVLKHFLKLIPKHRNWLKASTMPSEYHIQETYELDVGTVVKGLLSQGHVYAHDELELGPDENGEFRVVQVRSIQIKHSQVKHASAGQVASFCLKDVELDPISLCPKDVERDSLRKGMVLVHKSLDPEASYTFEALVELISHPSTVKQNFSPVIHIGSIRQTGRMISIQTGTMESGDKSLVRFQFWHRPEYIHIGQQLILREEFTRGLGTVTKINLEPRWVCNLEHEEHRKNGRIRISVDTLQSFNLDYGP